jgi:trk system potassium uptake protein TrkA
MYIIIINEDPLGRALAATLVDHGHEVAYVDEKAEYCGLIATELGCLVIQGEPTNIRILKEAGIERADIVVALLEKDIKNIMVGIFSRQFKVPRILARLRQEHYRSAYEIAGIQDVFSAFDHLLNQFVIAIETPNVRHVMRFGDGRIEIAAIGVTPKSALLSAPLNAIWEDRHFPTGALLLGLLKNADQTFHLPRDRSVLENNDEVLVAGSPDDINRIAAIINPKRRLFG